MATSSFRLVSSFYSLQLWLRISRSGSRRVVDLEANSLQPTVPATDRFWPLGACWQRDSLLDWLAAIRVASAARGIEVRSRRPDRQRYELSHVLKVLVSCQHRQFVAHTKPCKQSIDRSDLNALATTGVAQLRRVNMIVSIRG